MLIPKTATNNRIALNDLLSAPYNYGRDDDSDTFLSASGSITLTITDANGRSVARNATLHVNPTCSNPNPAQPYTSPFKVVLSSTAGTLKTRYGNPNRTNYAAATATYYIKPKVAPSVIACYAQPNLQYSESQPFGNSSIVSNWVGPASQWDNIQGFKTQNINSPSTNFPTMGANNLFFNLSMTGNGANYNNVRYDKSPANSGLSLSIESGGSTNIAKITLTGPKYGDSSATANTAVPTTFTIYADTNKTNKIYSFTIGKWFIARPGEGGGYNASYCRNTYGSNYRIPNVTEYTNANGEGWTGGLPGQPNNYQCRIGGGLFAEWGMVSSKSSLFGGNAYYTGSGFDQVRAWAVEAGGIGQHSVSASSGYVGSNNPGETAYRFVCVTP
ncbi:hypothetical protein PT273_06125 [Orbaceae bacterium ESL0727]|nr:hypothetical protein [Orbaceae bacterium ESL0727]